MLLQCLGVRAAGDLSRDRVLYFEVRGRTVQHKIPQSSVYQAFLCCCICSLCFHGLILNAWVESFGSGETNSRGIGMRQRRSCIFRSAVYMD